MISIKVNGEDLLIRTTSLSELMHQLCVTPPFFAVAVNRSVIPRSEHERVVLKEGDEVEVVHAVGGG